MNTFLPKWLVWGLGGLLIIFVALLIVQQAYSFVKTVQNQKPANTIQVSGDGQVTATPDLATVDIGVMTQASTAEQAKDQNNTKINAVIAFIKQQGIATADITTSQINLYPQQGYGGVMVVPGGPISPSTPKITGYQGEQTVTVKVHGVDKDESVLAKILDGSVNAGANEVDGVNFTFDQTTLNSLQQSARQQAIDNAKSKAQGLAQEAGLSLGKVVSISETNTSGIVPMPFALNSAMGSAGGTSTSVAPDVQPGTQDITESMSVTFEVK